MSKKLSPKGKELCRKLRKILTDDEYVCTMLALYVNQEDPDRNYQQMIGFLEANPNATKEEIFDKEDEILGIEDPFPDEDDE